ncbi:MAG: DUF3566 domain-containing protein [bacterium]
MRYQVKAIGVWSFTKLAFVVNLAVGFLFGIAYALFLIPMMALMANMPGFSGSGLDTDMAPLGLLIVIIPIMSAMGSAVFGTLGGVVMVLVYNLAAKMLGGLEVTFEPIADPSAMPAPPTYPTTSSAPPPPPRPPAGHSQSPTSDGTGGQPEV